MSQTPFDNMNSPHRHAAELRASEQLALPKAKEITTRPDGQAMRVLRAVTYVLVIITCIGLLYSMLEVHIWVHDLKQAMQSWVDGVTTTGILGN